MESWPQLQNALVTPSRVHTIGEKDNVEVLSVINPERGAGESRMADSVVR